MSGPRLTSGMLVGAIIRQTQALGGHAMVLARGDETAGALLVALTDRGEALGFFERGLVASGGYDWVRCGPAPEDGPEEAANYLERRRRFDPDLWVIEVDLRDGEAMLAAFGSNV